MMSYSEHTKARNEHKPTCIYLNCSAGHLDGLEIYERGLWDLPKKITGAESKTHPMLLLARKLKTNVFVTGVPDDFDKDNSEKKKKTCASKIIMQDAGVISPSIIVLRLL